MNVAFKVIIQSNALSKSKTLPKITYTQLTFDDEPDRELQRAYEQTGVTESKENDEHLQAATN